MIKLKTTAISVGVFYILAAAILGPDLGLVWRTVKSGAKKQIESLLDQTELKIAKVDQAIDRIEAGLESERELLVKITVKQRLLEKKSDKIRVEVEKHQSHLTMLRSRIEQNKAVYTSTGNVMTPNQTETLIAKSVRAIESGTSQLNALKASLKTSQPLVRRLKERVMDWPNRLATLRSRKQSLTGQLELLDDLKELAQIHKQLDPQAESDLAEASAVLDETSVYLEVEFERLSQEGDDWTAEFDDVMVTQDMLLKQIDSAMPST